MKTLTMKDTEGNDVTFEVVDEKARDELDDKEPKGTAEEKMAGHNTSNEAHNDIRLLIQGLTTRLNALANSDDVTLDQMAEVVAYIKSNKALIDGITTSKVNVADIIDNLTTSVTNKPLSAKQGVQLKALIDKIVVPTLLSQLSGDATHRTVTDAEKQTWNNKSNFSGNYNDLSNKPTIPSKTSQLANDSGFAKQTDVDNLSKEIANYLPKNQGAGNVGKILMVGTDGNLVLTDMPEGGASGDIIGTFDENNNILFSGDIAIGTYTLAYVNADGTISGAGSLVVSEITEPEPAEPTNFANPQSSDWKTGYRLTTDAFQFKAVTGSEVTNFVDVQNGDIVYVEGINFTDGNNRQTVSQGSKALGIGTVAQWAANTASYYVYGETTYDSNSLQFKVNTLGQGTIQVRFSGLVTGTSNDVVINIKRNGEWL